MATRTHGKHDLSLGPQREGPLNLQRVSAPTGDVHTVHTNPFVPLPFQTGMGEQDAPGPPVGRRRGVLVPSPQEPLFDGVTQPEPGFTLPRLDVVVGSGPPAVAKMILGGHGKNTRQSSAGLPTDGDSPTGYRGPPVRSNSEKEGGMSPTGRLQHTTTTAAATVAAAASGGTGSIGPSPSAADSTAQYRSLKVAVPPAAVLAAAAAASGKRVTASPRSWFMGQDSPSGGAASLSPGPRNGSPMAGADHPDMLSPGAGRAGVLQPLGANTGVFINRGKSLDLSHLSAYENVVGYMLDSSGDANQGVSGNNRITSGRTIGRKSLLLKLPCIVEGLAVDLPAMVEDRDGNACLVVLPSDKPSSRAEALAVERVLGDLLRNPRRAVHKAIAWRTQILSTLCSDALISIGEVMHSDRLGQRPLGQTWHFRLPSRGLPVKPAGAAEKGAEKDAGAMDVVDLLSRPPVVSCIQPQPPPMPRMSMAGGTTGAGGAVGTVADAREPPDRGYDAYATGTSASHAAPSQAIQESGGLCLSASILMADIIRQVEVHCGERGRALAYVWNTFLVTNDKTMNNFQADNKRLTAANAQLSNEVDNLQREVSEIEYLRREIGRFRTHAKGSEKTADKLLVENLALIDQAEKAKDVVARLHTLMDQQLARLRWQHAFHTLGLHHQRVLYVSGGLRQERDIGREGSVTTLLLKIRTVIRLQEAVLLAEARKKAFGLRRSPEDYSHPVSFTNVVKQSLHTTYQEKWMTNVEALGAENILKMLPGLQPEGQILVLANMTAPKRKDVLNAMTASHRAALVAMMSEDLRDEAKLALGDDGWAQTLLAMRGNPELAAKLLSVIAVHEAVLHLSNWTLEQQAAAIQAMEAAGFGARAALLLSQLPSAQRKTLMSRLEPRVVASILQSVDAERGLECLEGLGLAHEVEILKALTPVKAAALLTRLGTDATAARLMTMGAPEMSNAILGHLPPKDAAAALLVMNEMAAEQEAKRQQEQRAREAAAAEAGTGPEGSVGGEAQAAGTEPGAAGAADAAKAAAAADPMGAHAEGGAGGGGGADGAAMALGGAALLSMEHGAANSIMEHIGFKDKAGLLASLDPSKVSEMLALMSPDDTLLLLATMSDVSRKLVAGKLSQEDRDKLLDALRLADDDAATAGGGAGKKKGTGKKGSKKGGSSGKKSGSGIVFDARARDQIADAWDAELGREMFADEDAEAWLGDGEEGEAEGEEGEGGERDGRDGEGRRRSGGAPRMRHSEAGGMVRRESGANAAIRRRTLSGAVEAEAGSPTGAGGGAASPFAARSRRASMAGGAAGGGTPSRRQSGALAFEDSEQRRGNRGGAEEEEGEWAEAEEGARVGGGSGVHRQRSNLGRSSSKKGDLTFAEEVEGDEEYEEEYAEDEEVDGATTPQPTKAKKTGSKKAGTAKGSNLKREGSLKTGEKAGKQGSGAGAGGRDGPGGAAGRTSRGGNAAARRAAAGDKGGDSLKAAFDEKSSVVRRVVKAVAKSAVVEKAKEVEEWNDAIASAISSGPATGQGESQAKLGKLPKNQRLKDAMAQHKNAKPKPKGWLMSVVDQIYKDADAIVRKLGRSEALRKQSVPEVVFAYFHNKYGQKNVVNEYVGALVNTLMLYKSTDLNLEAFAKFLSEEWDFSTFLDFLAAQSMLLAPARVVAIEWPKDERKGEQYAWTDFYKALNVADAVLGSRPAPVRERFTEFVMAAATQVDEADAEQVRRDKRYAGESIPERFFRLPRIKFLMVLCKEQSRINAAIGKLAEDKFSKLDLQRTGEISVKQIGGYLSSMVSPGTSPGALTELQHQFLTMAEAQEKDIPEKDVQLDGIQSVSREPFVQASIQSGPIREHFKATLLTPARMDDDVDEQELYKTLLMGMMQRHAQAMMPHLLSWLREVEKDALLKDLVTAIGKETTGDGKFKAYLNLLSGIINVQIQGMVDMAAANDSEEHVDTEQLEEQLMRLEDTVVLMLHGDRYVMLSDPKLARDSMQRVPLARRMAHANARLKMQADLNQLLKKSAAQVFFAVWKRRKAIMALRTAAGGGQPGPAPTPGEAAGAA